MKNITACRRRIVSVAFIALACSLGHAAAVKLIPRGEVEAYLRVRAIIEGNERVSMANFVAQYGEKAAYPEEDIKNYKPSVRVEVADAEGAPARLELEKPRLRLRRSFSDVLATEDPSLADAGAKSFDDLTGATLSFARDFGKDLNTWSAQGALLLPFVWHRKPMPILREGDPFQVGSIGLIPSVSLHRVSNDGDDDEDEVNQVSARLGVFSKWVSGYAVDSVTLRGFASYVTDFKGETDLYAGEFELEPQIFGGKNLRVGYRTTLGTDSDRFAYQLRLLLHGEFGRYEDVADREDFEGEYNFLRVGPIVYLDLKPFFTPRLSLSFSYKYLPAIIGRNEHDSLLTADVEYFLVDPSETPNSRWSIKASYLNGGLDLTQTQSHTLVIGLGAAF